MELYLYQIGGPIFDEIFILQNKEMQKYYKLGQITLLSKSGKNVDLTDASEHICSKCCLILHTKTKDLIKYFYAARLTKMHFLLLSQMSDGGLKICTILTYFASH